MSIKIVDIEIFCQDIFIEGHGEIGRMLSRTRIETVNHNKMAGIVYKAESYICLYVTITGMDGDATQGMI